MQRLEISCAVRRMSLGAKGLKINVISIKIGANGIISRSFRKYLSNKLGKQVIKELRKTAVLGTDHVIREVLT